MRNALTIALCSFLVTVCSPVGATEAGRSDLIAPVTQLGKRSNESKFLVWSRDGDFLVTWEPRSSRARKLQAWQSQTWELVGCTRLFGHWHYSIRVVPTLSEDRLFVHCRRELSNSEARRQHKYFGEELFKTLLLPSCELDQNADATTGFLYSPSGKRRAFNGTDSDGSVLLNLVVVEETQGGEEIARFTPYKHWASPVAFDATDEYLVVKGRNERGASSSKPGHFQEELEPTICVWDLARNDKIEGSPLVDVGKEVVGFAGLQALVTVENSLDSTRVWVTDLSTGKAVLRQEGVSANVELSPSGTYIALLSPLGVITFWNWESGWSIKWKAHADQPKLSFSPDGKWFATTGYRDTRVLVWKMDDIENAAKRSNSLVPGPTIRVGSASL